MSYLVPDFASIVNIILFSLLTHKMSGNATLGDPSLNAFQLSILLNRLTRVSSQL